MGTHRIGVISDTHMELRQEVLDVLETCEAILHAGDIGDPVIIDRLGEIALTFAVRGNVDKEWREASGEIPMEREFTLFGYRFYMVHDIKDIPDALPGIDIVVYGHSHKAAERRVTDPDGKEILYLNPGSCGPRRFRQPVTMMVLTLYDEVRRMEAELIECLPGRLQETGEEQLSGRDLHKLIKRVMKDVDAGRNVADIAARNHMNKTLAEQICRMYLTHPGVGVDGIMDRIKFKK